MNDDPANPCSGCIMLCSENGGPATPAVAGGAAGATGVSFSFLQVQDPSQVLATVTVNFESAPGSCDPNANCAPKDPCIFTPKTITISNHIIGTMFVTVKRGDRSARYQYNRTWFHSNPDTYGLPLIIGMPGLKTEPFRLEMPCGSPALELTIEWESEDPSIGQKNMQSKTIKVECSACTGD